MASHIPNAFALFLVFCLAASASFFLVLAIKETANDRIFLMKDLAGKA
jgi:steroid 5-alpha reductase family enzyme